MKKQTLALSLVLMTSAASASDTVRYVNGSGCVVDLETRSNGRVFYVSKDGKTEVVGITNDFEQGSFSYCNDSALQIHYMEGSRGTGIMLSCDAHDNDHARTRGRVDIEIIEGALKKISIDGQVKRLLGWRQDVLMNCDGLLPEKN
jgi:hypothetical protein